MSIKALQEYTYISRYARYNKHEKRREQWSEAVERVKQMYLRKFPEQKEIIENAFEQVLLKKVLGSQRALQFGGSSIEQKNARMYNCCVSFCDRVRFFQECFWLLLCGCGTGFSVQNHHIEKLPAFHPSRRNGEKHEDRVYIVPDSIEGWADSLGILLATYLPHEEFSDWYGKNVIFDYSLIRPAGSILASGVGKAPGAEPLKRSIEIVRGMLEDRCRKQDKLNSIDAYDIVMHTSDAVLSGGVRRSATICLFSQDDIEMRKAKTGNWFIDNPQRARSNNSVVLLRDKVTKEEFTEIMKDVQDCGEPGFYFTDHVDQLPNPCFHRDTRILTENGWQKVSDLHAFEKSLKVVIDNRPGKESELNMDYSGTSLKDASKIKLTQKNANIYEVTTTHGHTIKVTENHEFPTLRGRLKLKDMVEGDKILLQSGEGLFGDFGTYQQGLLLGLVTGDGCFNEDEAWIDVWEDDFIDCEEIQNFVNEEISVLPSISNGGRTYSELEWQDQTSSKVSKKRMGGRRLYRFFKETLHIDNPASIKDRVPDVVWSGSREFVRGYIQGLISSVQMTGQAKKTTVSTRISQSNKLLLQDVQVILSNFGVVSRLYSRRPAGMRLLPDGHGEKRNYFCKESFELIISRPNCVPLKERIGIFGRKNKLLTEFLNLRGEDSRKPEKYVTSVLSIKYWGKDDVYCLTQYDTNTVIANGIVTGQCVEIGMWPVHENTGESGWQMCVSGDTKLLMNSGVATISSIVGQKVKIWNGKSWSEVTPFITGHNRELFRVHLSDGSFLDCTDNHRWLVKDRFQKEYAEVETKDLMSFSKYKIHTPRANIIWEDGVVEPMAYNYGFMLGDGTARHGHSPSARLYKNDRTLALIGSRGETKINEYGTEYENFSFSGLNNELAVRMKSKDRLLDEVFSWNKESAAEFISGWIDADGSKANDGCRLYGTEGRLRDAQLLLTRIGVNCSINLMASKGEKTNKGVRNQDVWYLQIPDARKLNSYRIDTSQGKIYNGKGKFQVIRYVEKLPGLHTTYCVTEPDLHQCLFNNVLTKQCNLCEINGKKIKSKEDFAKVAKAAAIIGTLQASYTDFDYLGQVTKEIVEREALLGVSITGMMDNPDIIFDPEIQKEMAQLILDTNEWMAKRIGINPAARATCVKPAGTTSCILGSASGIHPHHAKRYFRRIQGNNLEAPLQYFKEHNQIAVEKSVWSANNTDEVITFCVEVPDGAKTKNQLSALKLLDYVKTTQKNWVNSGKRPELCTQPWLTHNVSNTINVLPEEWPVVTDYIYDNRNFFAGIALLPQSGDLDYPQAPMCTIHTSKEIVQMYGEGSLFASGLIVDGLRVFDNNLWAACDAVLGRVDLVQPADEALLSMWLSKKDFIRRAVQFAERYFDGDVRHMTYCLKEVHNWKLWQDLEREYKDVDYSLLKEEVDATKPMDTIACSGGACQI